MIFIMSSTPPVKPGYYWALVSDDKGGEPTWQPVEVEDVSSIWIVGSDIPAYADWVKDWKWGPELQAPQSPVKEKT